MPRPIVFIAALLLSLPAFAQTRMPARQVEVDTNMVNIAVTLPFTAQAALDWIDANWPALSSSGWSNIDPDEDTVQAVFDWIDENWQPDLVTTNWLFLDPSEDTSQSTFDWLDDWFVSMGASNGFLRGTNIFGFTFADGVWTPPDELVGVENFAFVRDTNLTSTSAWGVEVVSNASWDAEAGSWVDDGSGTNTVAFFSHPPFVTADGINFPSFVTKEEFYDTLNAMGFANYDSYTAETGSYESPWQAWAVPPNLTVGQVISVHLWGAGGGAAGGYARGDLVVVDPTNYATVGTNAWAVTNEQVLVVQVGTACQRSAVWRRDGPDFSTMSNELLVAGAAGAYGENRVSGGYGGGLAGLVGANVSIGGTYWGTQYGGLPGTQTNGGAGGMSTRGSSERGTATTGAAGTRIFGGSGVTSDGGRGGDGYYGGGQGGWRSFYNDDPELYEGNAGGGGGSGYVVPGWSNATAVVTSGTNSVTNTLVAFTAPGSLTQPPRVSETAYGLNAGYPGNPGRVAFEIKFDSWGKTP